MKLIIKEGEKTERKGTLMQDISHKEEKANSNFIFENIEKETEEKE